MFGQGLTTTAVQIASVYQTIANGGVRMPVQLVEGCTDADGDVTTVPPTDRARGSSPRRPPTRRARCSRCVYRRAGSPTGRNIPGYRVAAKTGTAQMPDGNGGYLAAATSSRSPASPRRTIPQYVVSVSITESRLTMNSSAASAPVFQQVMSQVLKKYRTVPSGAPAPELPADLVRKMGS